MSDLMLDKDINTVTQIELGIIIFFLSSTSSPTPIKFAVSECCGLAVPV